MSEEKSSNERALEACRRAYGSDWNALFSGHQQELVDAWLDGYQAALDDRLSWLAAMFDAAEFERIADMDEVQNFVDWVRKRMESGLERDGD